MIDADRPQLEDLHVRLTRMEREKRWLKRTGIVVLTAVGSLLLMGQAQQSQTKEAEKFVLRDAKGRVRAILHTTQDSSPRLVLFDAEGNDRAERPVSDQLEFIRETDPHR